MHTVGMIKMPFNLILCGAIAQFRCKIVLPSFVLFSCIAINLLVLLVNNYCSIKNTDRRPENKRFSDNLCPIAVFLFLYPEPIHEILVVRCHETPSMDTLLHVA